MLFENPHLYENEDLMSFCHKYNSLYIYGSAINQQYLYKYLTQCGIKVNGFVVTDNPLPIVCSDFVEIPVMPVCDVVSKPNVGIIIALSSKHYDGVIPNLRKIGFTDYFLMSEHNKITIAHKMRPRQPDRMWIEVNVVDHCNLNCQCCDHFSQLVKEPKFLDFNVFKRDVERLAELSENHIDIFKLQGGEPLLHEDVNKFVECTRSLFPKAIIYFFTNGLLLMKSEKNKNGNFWQCCKCNDVTVQLTEYPVGLNIDAIEEKAKEYEVKLQVFGEVADRVRGKTKRTTRHPFDIEGNVPKWQAISCYHFNETITLRDGRLYTCSIIPYANYFNDAFGQNLELTDDNSIDIYEAKSYKELAEFVTRRVPFCNYCDIKNRHTLPWARSKKSLNEYVNV